MTFVEKEGKASLIVDLTLLTKKDNGTWEISFELTDEHFGTSFQKNSYEAELKVNYQALPVEQTEFVPTFTVETNFTFTLEEEEEPEEVVFEGTFVEPLIDNTRNIAPVEEVR